jgi:hypothetical protein
MGRIIEHRFGRDRRAYPRGGRRPKDGDGFAPLVLLVDGGAGAVIRSEAILAKLRFAVTTSSSVEEALRVVAGLRPDVVVASEGDAGRIRIEGPQHLPVVVMNPELGENPDLLLDQIRKTLRSNEPR